MCALSPFILRLFYEEKKQEFTYECENKAKNRELQDLMKENEKK